MISASLLSEPEIALSLTTYQKPWHLRRALASIAGQRGVEGRMELVVTDDGSTDETPQIVEEFSTPCSISGGVHHARTQNLPSLEEPQRRLPGHDRRPYLLVHRRRIAFYRPTMSQFISCATKTGITPCSATVIGRAGKPQSATLSEEGAAEGTNFSAGISRPSAADSTGTTEKIAAILFSVIRGSQS